MESAAALPPDVLSASEDEPANTPSTKRLTILYPLCAAEAVTATWRQELLHTAAAANSVANLVGATLRMIPSYVSAR
jgi:hypothetical protein